MAAIAGRLDIYNMALGFIGCGTIASPNEHRPEAVQCGLYWDRARRSALRDFPYNFARRRVELAEKELPEEYCCRWQHAYAIPNKCIKVVKVLGHGAEKIVPDEFVIRNDGEVNIILTDVCDAHAEIVFDNDDITLWDEAFIMAMARKLACLISTPLLKNNQAKMQELESLYRQSIPDSEGDDASESRRHRIDDTWLLAREGW